MYESSFQTLSERLFKDTPWPSVDAVTHYVDNDHVFCLLYREMWFHHLYAHRTPTLCQRIGSWDNYYSLFQVVLHGIVNMQLPNKWLYSIGDIFPSVSLNFERGASMVKPEQYLMHYGFLKVQEGVTILGDLLLKDKIFVYDLAHQRIGLANYDLTTRKHEYINARQLSVSFSEMDILSKLLPSKVF